MSDPPQPLGPFGGFDLSQMLRFLQSDGPVHWEVARQVAPAAEQRVLAETGDAPTSRSVALLSRAEWADHALEALRPVLERLAVSLQGELPDFSAEGDEGGDPGNPFAGNPFAGLFGMGSGPGADRPGGPGEVGPGAPGGGLGANPLAGMAGMFG